MRAALLAALCAPALGRVLHPDSPPLGWNSYDSFGASNESVTLATAQEIKAKLLPLGWDYVTIDAGWFGADATPSIDQYGRLIPNPALYPSTAKTGSFKPVADAVHALGLKFGLWNMFGVPQVAVARKTPIKGTNYTADQISLGPGTECPWDNKFTYSVDLSHPAGRAYYQSVAELWDEWGVDLMKLDCVFAENETPQRREEVKTISGALDARSRDFLLSLSPGGQANASQVEAIRPFASMARITQDFWDDWSITPPPQYPTAVYPLHFDVAQRLCPLGGQGFWTDLDMLSFGRIGHEGQPCSPHGPGCPRISKLTPDEQRTVATLWTICQSPLVMGGDLRAGTTPDATHALLTNSRVLEALRDGSNPYQAIRTDSLIVWASHSRTGPSSARYVGVFNVADTAGPATVTFDQLGLTGQSYSVYDLWAQQSLGEQLQIRIGSLPAHAPAFFKVTDPAE
eukprot:TRINITY_DN24774_c0_g1_i1.p1 TRINITY_DN24774_c0_g1~~TRINITY_DN24774_c0_g1_i1.p1  ORF type:complete len:465 (+),score=69.52 TRINITY_DN24774_c0_g1_i1:27-1397(+)